MRYVIAGTNIITAVFCIASCTRLEWSPTASTWELICLRLM